MKMMVQVVEDVKSESDLVVQDSKLMGSELWWSTSIKGTRSYESRRSHSTGVHGTSPRRGQL
jgi:hypothetical protein